MSSETPIQLPIELTRKIGRTLFPGRDVLPEPPPPTVSGRLMWFGEIVVNWLILILAMVNFAVVVFDVSYLKFRHHVMAYAPEVVYHYDKVKGVEPHQTTEAYMAQARETFRVLEARPGSREARAALNEMRGRSLTMIQEDPFAGAGLSGVWEKTKNRVRSHMELESARQAFEKYWSPENLAPGRLGAEQAWFNTEIRPLVARNYYRHIGEDGRPYDAFWLIDLCFIPFFILEFLIRGAVGVRRGTYPSWKAFFMLRWYDLVYFLPLLGYLPMAQQGPVHLVRVISVGYRMQRLGLINPVAIGQRQAEKVTNVLTDIVNVKLLTNYQESVRQFDLARALGSLTPDQREEMRGFIDRNMTMVVTRVIPAASPEIEALLTRSVHQAMAQSPAYQGLARLPMFSSLTQQVLPAIVAEIVAGTQQSLAQALTDPETRELTERAIEKFSLSLLQEMARMGTEEDVKKLVIDMLEEQKTKLLS